MDHLSNNCVAVPVTKINDQGINKYIIIILSR